MNANGQCKEAEAADARKALKRQVLLVDDHPMTREGLAANINRQPDLEVGKPTIPPKQSLRFQRSSRT